MYNYSLLNDIQMENLCSEDELKSMFFPYNPKMKESGVISHGQGAFGYDLRIGRDFKIFMPSESVEYIDPKNFDQSCLLDVKDADYVMVPANGFVLASTLEYIRIPEDCLMLFSGKSTYARCGIVANFTPGEPGWHGHLTVEISNTGPLPVKVYAGEGFCQAIVLRGAMPRTSYLAREGKYNGQLGITLPKIKNVDGKEIEDPKQTDILTAIQ